jgi:EAL domain-containing protein (putative c-di-GMP-specific phosphodiesterase class I)
VTSPACDTPSFEQGQEAATAAESADRCSPSPSGCLRCQSLSHTRHARSRMPQAALLLGPEDADSDMALRRLLDGATVAYTSAGAALCIPEVRERLGEIGALLQDGLSLDTRARIRAAYAPAGAEEPGRALAAFPPSEPLATMLEQFSHLWVQDALAEEWLFSEYQPILDARTGAQFAQEALLRAQDPAGGPAIGAGPIIAACQALNLHHQLDQRARQAAIRGAATHVPAPARIFINFLPNTIYDPEICLRTTIETAVACGVQLGRLVFEVVETERIPDLDHLRRILNFYRARGIATAIDDMGAGYTSVDYITTLRPDYVKLDRKLLVAPGAAGKGWRRIEWLVATAHRLGARVIAEGIETREQLRGCVDAGVDYVQGFLFARPACPPLPARLPEL